MKVNKLSVSSVLFAGWLMSPTTVEAHGYNIFPEARQSVCYNDSGLWNGNWDSAACGAANAVSGNYAFIQRNEVAINIPAPDYNDITKVKEAIPDGTLCYANDYQKRGLGVEHSEWERTEIAPGTFEMVFQATAPHNPSFWEIYITKQGVDVSKPLNWDDLELIAEHGNIFVDGEMKYRMDVTIPEGRSGDAVLYTRWQRIDPVGEGFYNCSDIAITGEGGNPPPELPEPHLTKGASFVPSDIDINTPQIGEVVKYQVFNSYGELHNEFNLKIEEDNTEDWDRLLATHINGYYNSHHEGSVFVGDWHEEMSHYMYFSSDLGLNYFNSLDGEGYGQFSIVQDESPSDLDAVVTPMSLVTLTEAKVQHGTTIVLHPNNSVGDFDSVQWQQTGGTHVDYTIGQYDELMIDTHQLTETDDHELSFKLTVHNDEGNDTAIYSFVVEGDANETPPPPSGSDWNSASTYTEGDTVEHSGQTWTAQWWTQGEEPGTTGEWGVWR
ncbi:lytic polysaccharide monooxygenase [Vibrio sp. FNV 38]|nr:lytic polysaccharide monooxygenase [Vibrio sp. FNV 38]